MSRRFAVGRLTAASLVALALTGPVSAQQFHRAAAPSAECDGGKPACGFRLGSWLRPSPRLGRTGQRPLCNPCNLEHFGYYHTCWASWPFPADYRHCPCGPAAVLSPPPATTAAAAPVKAPVARLAPKPVAAKPVAAKPVAAKPVAPPRAAVRPAGYLLLR